MYNHFLLIGPENDPAGVKSTKTLREALIRIAKRGCLFLSRGDNSGTHTLEKRLWKEVRIDPTKERWYQETGQGMGFTLKMAFEKGGYTISDNGTYLALKRSLKREASVLRDPRLLNIYSVIEVNPKVFKKVNSEGAQAFSEFLVSQDVQNFIGSFGKEKYGSPLFIPCAGKDKEVEQWK